MPLRAYCSPFCPAEHTSAKIDDNCRMCHHTICATFAECEENYHIQREYDREERTPEFIEMLRGILYALPESVILSTA